MRSKITPLRIIPLRVIAHTHSRARAREFTRTYMRARERERARVRTYPRERHCDDDKSSMIDEVVVDDDDDGALGITLAQVVPRIHASRTISRERSNVEE